MEKQTGTRTDDGSSNRRQHDLLDDRSQHDSGSDVIVKRRMLCLQFGAICPGKDYCNGTDIGAWLSTKFACRNVKCTLEELAHRMLSVPRRIRTMGELTRQLFATRDKSVQVCKEFRVSKSSRLGGDA